jgi:hypothetical protein
MSCRTPWLTKNAQNGPFVVTTTSKANFLKALTSKKTPLRENKNLVRRTVSQSGAHTIRKSWKLGHSSIRDPYYLNTKSRKKKYARINIMAWRWARWSHADHGIPWCSMRFYASFRRWALVVYYLSIINYGGGTCAFLLSSFLLFRIR